MTGPAPAPTRVLVVDDEPASLDLLVEMLGEDGYGVEVAADAEQALRRLKAGGPRIDVILLDLRLPGMSGLELLRLVKHDPALQTIPVIFETATSDRAAVVEGISAGAYYHITKPIDREMLLSVVGTAAEDHARYQRLQKKLRQGVEAVSSLEEGLFRFRTLEQASALAQLLSQACPEPDRVVVGLDELLTNAVEHGNLGVSYAEKSALLELGDWHGEVRRRLALPENLAKRVEVRFRKGPSSIAITITDEGAGFDWRRYLTVTPDRILDRHGRGIAMAGSLSFDRLEYTYPGNRVEATISLALPHPA